MTYFKKWFCLAVGLGMSVGSATAADTIAAGKIKSINAEKKSFVLSDSAGKENTFGFGDELVVNRAGKESKSDLKVGDTITVSYDKGTFTWQANYILVQEGKTKNCELLRGTFKGYDADKKEMTYTSEFNKDATFPMGKANVRVNMAEGKIESLSVGEHVLLIVDTVDGISTLQGVMVSRATR